MKIYACYHTDGDAGWYRVRLYTTREEAEALKKRDGSAYFQISEIETDRPDTELEMLLFAERKQMALPENVKCPKCGGDMISRKGKFGIFWGCRKYPDCTGTRDSMGRSKDERQKQESDDRDREIDEQNGPSRFPFRKGR